MTLQERRDQWEMGGEIKLVATHKEVLTGGVVYDTVYVIMDFKGEYALHRYFPMGRNWEVSVDISNSTLDKCLEAISDVFETQLPE